MKIVLAYSGGLDTSVLLKQYIDQGHQVIAMTLNLGESDMVAGEGSQDALDLPGNFIVGHKLAAVQGVHAFLYFPLEPLVMVEIVRDQFLHDLVRGLARLGSDPGEPCLKFGS